MVYAIMSFKRAVDLPCARTGRAASASGHCLRARVRMPVDFAYFPIVGRGEQIRLICAEHGIPYEEIVPVGFGGETFKHGETPNGHLPWMKEKEDGLILNDSSSIVQYLIEKYPGPLTPNSFEAKMKSLDAWAFVQGGFLRFRSFCSSLPCHHPLPVAHPDIAHSSPLRRLLLIRHVAPTRHGPAARRALLAQPAND